MVFRVLYLFASKARNSDVGMYLKGLHDTFIGDWHGNWVIEEVDFEKDAGQGLPDADFRQSLLDRISAGFYNFLIFSPPGATFCRAVYANIREPRPVRSHQFPLGLPHLTSKEQHKVHSANEIIFFCFAAMLCGHKARLRGHWVRSILEHPEDLGAARLGVPASIWQLAECRTFSKRGFKTVVFPQCQFGVDYHRPTRLLSDFEGILGLGFPGWPVFGGNNWVCIAMMTDCKGSTVPGG